ncbi:hypothetical protein [Intrasporangium sp.]|uniref:hypothetical protein n=1 Tax=Intrasporangium sp. TaxID=1925024 RepID=UPI0033654569
MLVTSSASELSGIRHVPYAAELAPSTIAVPALPSFVDCALRVTDAHHAFAGAKILRAYVAALTVVTGEWQGL